MHSLSSALLKQRVGEFLRSGVRGIVGYLQLLIGLTQRESKLPPLFMTGDNFVTWSKASLKLGS